MNGADWYDIGAGLLSRRSRRRLTAVLVLLTGGGFATWYATERTESAVEMATTMQAVIQERMQGAVEDMFASLPAQTTPPESGATP